MFETGFLTVPFKKIRNQGGVRFVQPPIQVMFRGETLGPDLHKDLETTPGLRCQIQKKKLGTPETRT